MSRAKVTSQALSDVKSHLGDVSSSALEASRVIYDAASDASYEADLLIGRYDEKIAKVHETEDKAKKIVDHCEKELSNAQAKLNSTPETIKSTDENGNSVSKPNPDYKAAEGAVKNAKAKLSAAKSLLSQISRLAQTLQSEQADFQKLKRTIEDEGRRLESSLKTQASFADSISNQLEKMIRIVSEYESLSL